MKQKNRTEEPRPGVSKLKLAVGAASLFLFVVGLKRTFSMDDDAGGSVSDRPDDAPGSGGRETRAR